MAEPVQAAAPVPTSPLAAPDGQVYDVPLDQVGQYVREGGYAPTAPVAVEKQGKIDLLDPQAAQKFYQDSASLTAKTVTPEAHAAQEADKPWQTAGQRAAGFGLGVADFATLGGLPYLAAEGARAFTGEKETADKVRGYIAGQKEHNAGFYGAGEVVGAVLPSLLTGGGATAARGAAGAATRVAAAEGAEAAGLGLRALDVAKGAGRAVGGIATALPRAAGVVGEAAGGLAERAAVGLGASADGGLARTLSRGVQYGTEGALYGAGQAVGDAGLKDEPLDAEKILAGAGLGFGLGAGAGIGLSLAGKVARAAAGKVVEAGEGALGRIAGGEGALTKKVGEFADDQFVRSTGALKKQAGKLEELGPTIKQEVIRQTENDLAVAAGKEPGAFFAPAERAEAAAANLKNKGEVIGQLVGDVEKIAPDVKPNVQRAFLDSQKVVAELEAKGPLFETQAKQVVERLDQVRRTFEGKSFSEFHKARGILDSAIYDDKLGSKEVNNSLKKIRGLFEEELIRTGDEIAEKAGGGFRDTYLEAKKQYSAAKWLADTTEEAAVRHQANSVQGIRETVGALGGSSAGGTLGGAVGAVLGPAGSAVGHLVGNLGGAIAGGYVNHLGRLYGNQAAAKLARSAVTGNLLREVQATVDRGLSSRVGKLVAKGPQAVSIAAKELRPVAIAGAAVRAATEAPAPSKGLQARFEQARNNVAQAKANGARGAQESVAGIAETHPKEAQQLAAASLKATDFLASKLPAQLGAHDSLVPRVDKARVPTSEMAKFLRYQRAVDNPMTVVDDALAGRINRDGVEALKAVYPGIYQNQIVAPITQALGQRKAPLSYQQELQLGVLLDIPTRTAFTPSFIDMMQKSYAPQPTPAGGPAPRAPRRPVEGVADAYKTQTQTLLTP